MACSKIFSGDLPELISEIIQYFRNDISTLHSCILVNRLWCRLAIVLLWEDPFSKNFLKNYNFIEIYLHKLSENDKIKLNEFGINKFFPSNTLFNYPSFIKYFNTQRISSSIINWIYWTNNVYFDQNLKLTNFIFLSLIKIFTENEANLHTFELELFNTSDNIGINCFKSTFQLILQNPNFICNVKNLNIHLNGINVSMDNYIEKDLSKVINLQQDLKKIYFDYKLYPLKNLKNSNCSNTLKTIILHKVYFNNLDVSNFNEVFEQLNVLESIHFLYCYPLDSTIALQIFNLTKPFKLKSLLMDERSTLQVEPIKLLLQKSGNYLENIGFETSMEHDLKLELFKLFTIYCINIKFVNLLGFDNLNIFSALALIKNIQQNLNYLNINFCQFRYDQLSLSYDNELSSIILHNLGQILPYRLEYLGLALKFNINDLEMFFKNSQSIFIKKLLIRNKVYQDSDDILPCIKKYVMKEKRVTYLAIENLHVSFNENGKDLSYLKDEVREFEFYGIQVKNYNDLCIHQICDFINELY